MNKEITYWKWKNTIIDFNAISDEKLDYDEYTTKKDYVFRYLGIPDEEIHEWYNGRFSCEYNNALLYAKQLGLIENYIDYEDKIYDLQQRIDKAIEYIEEHKIYNDGVLIMNYIDVEELEDILKGINDDK